MKLNDQVETNILLQNNIPIDDFLGLSANQLHYLLYEPLGENSVVKFHDSINDDTLNSIPLFRIAEEYLKIIKFEKNIKLTPLGALPKKVMVALYAKNFLPDEFVETGITKLWKEEDCISIMSARLSVGLAGLTKKANGKISLTKNGDKFLQPENRSMLFKIFFQAFADKFSWSFNDGHPEEPIGQMGWAFSVYMLDKFGDKERDVDFYAEKYLKAFPVFLSFFSDSYKSKEQNFIRCYQLRTFDRFLLWFGFIKLDNPQIYSVSKTSNINRTKFLREVFIFGDV